MSSELRDLTMPTSAHFNSVDCVDSIHDLCGCECDQCCLVLDCLALFQMMKVTDESDDARMVNSVTR